MKAHALAAHVASTVQRGLRSAAWWYWLATALALTASVRGAPWGFPCALGLSALHLGHWAWRQRSATSFAVQVRLGYLLLLAMLALPRLQSLCWLPALGTWVSVLFDYCAMARAVSLLPWNRSEALSPWLVWRTFLSPPVTGCIVKPRAAGPRSASGR